mmetsp:Transcript_43464/g.101511  ORF Transcript_43464/g.101511 Transcript_43464/m.101511 type:complete len:256 (+) Transcript_43464:207-974(+)
MELGTRANGREIFEMVPAPWYGQMAQATSVNSARIWPKAWESSHSLMVTPMKANGWMIKLMARGNTSRWMGPSSKVTGWQTNSMVRARRLGLMVQRIPDSTCMARRQGKEPSPGAAGPSTPAASKTMRFMEKGRMTGLTAAGIMVNGASPRCMALVRVCGQTAGRTKVTTITTRSKVMVFSAGLMGAVLQASGKTASKMAQAASGHLELLFPAKACGRMESASNGPPEGTKKKCENWRPPGLLQSKIPRRSPSLL